jgi:hypothetical protein
MAIRLLPRDGMATDHRHGFEDGALTVAFSTRGAMRNPT